MATKLAKYVVQLEAQTARYEQKLDRANKKLNTFHRKQSAGLKKLSGAFRGLIPLVTVAALANIAKRSIDTADNFNKLVDRLGGSTEAFSELGFVAKRTGLQFRVMELGLQRMSRRVAEAAQGTGEAKGAIKELGLVAADLAQLPIDKQFEVIAEQLNKVGTASDKTRLAMKLFDAEGVALLQTMTDGAAGIQEMRTEARALGVTLSQEAADKATEAKDALTAFGAEASVVARDLAIALVPALTTTVTRLREFTVGLAHAFGATAQFPLQEKIEDLENNLASAKALVTALGGELEQFGRPADNPLALEGARANVELLEAALDSALAKQLELLAPPPVALDTLLPAGTIDPAEAAANAARATAAKLQADAAAKAALALETFRQKYEAVERTVKRNLAVLETWKGELSPEEFQAIGDAMRSELVEGIEEISVNVDKMIPKTKKAFDQMAAFSDQAARNMQDAFADFLFDPFEDGIKGMLRGFIDTLRRMVANQLALQIFGIFGGTGGIGKAIGGIFGRASGGPVTGGRPYVVGERGPELFVPQGAGNVVANGGLGGQAFTFITNIEAGGGNDPDKLIPLLDDRDRKLKAELVDEIDRGIYA